MINVKRLSDTFVELVKIDSISREEKNICDKLQALLSALNADTILVDNSMEKTGSNTGNLVAVFNGTVDVPAMMLSGHMDTVEPGRGINPQFDGKVFKSDGTTILGADDKSALAIILEVLRVLKENDLDHGPLEIVFTVCEEIGLFGAKNIDLALLKSEFGYILDSTDAQGIVTKAPFADRFEIKVHGKAAHAGAEPEKGISAVQVAAKAIAGLELGRIDYETTCNIGIMEAGKAINIVPDLAVIKGEARSHDKEKLGNVIADVSKRFRHEVDTYNMNKESADRATLDIHVEQDFPGTDISHDHKVVTLAKKASHNLGIPLKTVTIGGGADANVFFSKGITAGVLGTGMQNLHTTNESIALEDMVQAVELLLEIIKIHSRSCGERVK